MSEQVIDWHRIGRELAADFAPETVQWRVQGKADGGKRAQVVAYVDARTVQERLDAVVGPGGWSFELEPLVVDGGALRVARGRLSIFGVSKDDIGDAGAIEPSKSTASDAFKRAAVMWGIGRYLYSLPAVWVTLDTQGHIPAEMLAKLAAGLKRRVTAAANAAA